jgi:hypothetical protein
MPIVASGLFITDQNDRRGFPAPQRLNIAPPGIWSKMKPSSMMSPHLGHVACLGDFPIRPSSRAAHEFVR